MISNKNIWRASVIILAILVALLSIVWLFYSAVNHTPQTTPDKLNSYHNHQNTTAFSYLERLDHKLSLFYIQKTLTFFLILL